MAARSAMSPAMTSLVNCLAKGSLPSFTHTISGAVQPLVGGRLGRPRVHQTTASQKTTVPAPSANKRVDGELDRDHRRRDPHNPYFFVFILASGSPARK